MSTEEIRFYEVALQVHILRIIYEEISNISKILLGIYLQRLHSNIVITRAKGAFV